MNDTVAFRRCMFVFRYYELKMTVEEQEQLEELTYIGGSVRATSSGGSRASKESVEANQMTAVKQEERKRFLIRSVTDPRTGEMMALRDAVAAGIIDYKTGKYINPDTDEGKDNSQRCQFKFKNSSSELLCLRKRFIYGHYSPIPTQVTCIGHIRILFSSDSRFIRL